MEKKTTEIVQDIGKGFENLGCAITMLVIVGFFLWFINKTLF